MANLDDLDHASLIVDRVDDSVGTLTDAVVLLVSGELLTAAWTRSLGESLNARHNAETEGARLNRLELLGGGGLDENAIACHAAEGP
jgi:hypothetical protein